MAIRRPLWTNQEVDILVAAYAKAHKRNQSKFFTSKDWSCILNTVNKYKVKNFNTKNMKQIKNKIDTLIKTHKKEQAKQKNNCGMLSKWIHFNTMEEIQLIKDENHRLPYPTRACDKKTPCNSNPCSPSKINQNYSGRNDEETLDMYECQDEQFSEFSYSSCDSYSNSDFDKSDVQYDHEELDTPKESSQQLLCEWETNLQWNLKVIEPIKLSPDSDEFIEEVKRMFEEPTGDIANTPFFL